MDPSIEEFRVRLSEVSNQPTSHELSVLRADLEKLLDVWKRKSGTTEFDWLTNSAKVIVDRWKIAEPNETQERIPVERNGMPCPIVCFFGRDEEMGQLDAWVSNDSSRIIQLFGAGGCGKTQLATTWLDRLLLDKNIHNNKIDAVFCWCFYTFANRATVSHHEFLSSAIAFFENVIGDSELVRDKDRSSYLAELISTGNFLVVLDGLEALQKRPRSTREEKEDGDDSLQSGQIRRRFSEMKSFLLAMTKKNSGKLLITTRQEVHDLQQLPVGEQLKIKGLDKLAARNILRHLGVQGSDTQLDVVGEFASYHALSLTLYGHAIGWHHDGIVESLNRVDRLPDQVPDGSSLNTGDIFRSYRKWLHDSAEMELLRLIGFFQKQQVPFEDLECLIRSTHLGSLNRRLREALRIEEDDEYFDKLYELLSLLEKNGLLFATAQSEVTGKDLRKVYDVHPILRNHFRLQLLALEDGQYWRAGQSELFERYAGKIKDRVQSLDEAQVLYEAIGYACEAGLFKKAFDVYWRRIHQNVKSLNDLDWYAQPVWYARDVLGMYSQDLSALAWFYEDPWQKLQEGFDSDQQAVIRFATAQCLRVLGYYVEAGHPISSVQSYFESKDNYRLAAITSGWECERRLLQGKFPDALKAGENALRFAIRSADNLQILSKNGRLGDYYLQVGDWNKSKQSFAEALKIHAEILNRERQINDSPIGGYTGFLYFDYLLTRAEIVLAEWRLPAELGDNCSREEITRDVETVVSSTNRILSSPQPQGLETSPTERALHQFAYLRGLAIKNIWFKSQNPIVTQRSIDSQLRELVPEFEKYARGELPKLLVKRSKVLRRLAAMKKTEADRCLRTAYDCLNQALDIAKYGEMVVYEVDVYLEQAKVFNALSERANNSDERQRRVSNSRDLLRKATLIIEDIGYGKRLPECRAFEMRLEKEKTPEALNDS